MDNNLPRPTSKWHHSNGAVYVVLCIANEFTEQPERYPPTVVYMGLNGRVWSRAASDWHRSMTLVRDAVDEPVAEKQESQFDPARPVSAANLPDSMKITRPAAATFLSSWRNVVQQLAITRAESGVPGSIAGEPDGEGE